MAIAFDAATNGGTNSGIGSHTFAHTCSGTDRLLIVGFMGQAFGGTDFVTGVTYNGVAMTSVTVGGPLVHSSLVRYHHTYILVNPASGTHNVVVSISSNQYVVAAAASYTGCLQTGQPHQFDTTIGGTGGASSNVTTSLDNCWLVVVETNYPGTAAGTPPATERVHNAEFAVYIFDSNGPISPAGATGLTTTRTGASYGTGHVLVALAPIPGGGETAVASADFF